MVSCNFLLRAQHSIKEILLDADARKHFRYMRVLVGTKNIVAGVLLLAENKRLDCENLAYAANHPRKLRTVVASDVPVDAFNPIHLNVENNEVDILTASGHAERFLFSLLKKPMCITRKFKGFKLTEYSDAEKEFVNALLNSLVVKSLWLIAAARTYAVLTAHHINIVRREFLCIDWNRVTDGYRSDIVKLFRVAYPEDFVVPKIDKEIRIEAVKEFNCCVLEAIKCSPEVYQFLVNDIDEWYQRPNHSTDLKIAMKI